MEPKTFDHHAGTTWTAPRPGEAERGSAGTPAIPEEDRQVRWLSRRRRLDLLFVVVLVAALAAGVWLVLQVRAERVPSAQADAARLAQAANEVRQVEAVELASSSGTVAVAADKANQLRWSDARHLARQEHLPRFADAVNELRRAEAAALARGVAVEPVGQGLADRMADNANRFRRAGG